MQVHARKRIECICAVCTCAVLHYGTSWLGYLTMSQHTDMSSCTYRYDDGMRRPTYHRVYEVQVAIELFMTGTD